MSRLLKSFRYAFLGLRQAWKTEQNFRLQTLAGALVFLLAWYVHLSALRLIVVVLLITLVLVLELLNTFFERLVDLISPRIHAYAAMLKDLLAASVFVASIGAVVAGILIFLPYLPSVHWW
ncbi:diacylglycerol kinase [Candidatus Uhrbacteria bacterium CG10_big_fil_rev_8_21_14_0_10_48_11]|uniref:Diacylglycerol kinase n=1 Tax=Candidatus Uhrbacteria bacterium CG10_big_fil_rev_8_21_14_0_10_48_11 TaxID=1975037 RepID=A0A2M8LF57_9BACT|nr:MAG: diacylglycerol kinase [Candidatus Uhrbacteria bacterium CG10_big_fil_rev_8_21_14_0_10_48_11]